MCWNPGELMRGKWEWVMHTIMFETMEVAFVDI